MKMSYMYFSCHPNRPRETTWSSSPHRFSLLQCNIQKYFLITVSKQLCNIEISFWISFLNLLRKWRFQILQQFQNCCFLSCSRVLFFCHHTYSYNTQFYRKFNRKSQSHCLRDSGYHCVWAEMRIRYKLFE